MINRIILTIALGIVAQTLPSLAQPNLDREDLRPHIYQLRINLKDGSGRVLGQTAFHLAGTDDGLITSLHGVAQLATLSATLEGPDGQKESAGRRLSVLRFNKDCDLAIVGSEALAQKLAEREGLPLSPHMPGALEPLVVWGFPRGVGLSRNTLMARDPAVSTLKLQLDGRLISAFENRLSPNLDIRAIDIEGELLEGHSGAPILTEDGAVVGVATGGVVTVVNNNIGVSTELNFATPLDNECWTDPSKWTAWDDPNRDGLLASVNPDLAGIYNTLVLGLSLPLTRSFSEETPALSMSSEVSISEAGKGTITTRMENKDEFWGHCGAGTLTLTLRGPDGEERTLEIERPRMCMDSKAVNDSVELLKGVLGDSFEPAPSIREEILEFQVPDQFDILGIEMEHREEKGEFDLEVLVDRTCEDFFGRGAVELFERSNNIDQPICDHQR